MWIPPDIDPPTPAQYAIVVGLISGSLIVLGIIGFIFALRAPADKHDVAIALEHYSLWAIGIGLGIAFVAWLVRKLSD